MDLDINPYTLFFGFIFGIIGYASWRYGRKQSSERHLVLAVMLIAFSYFFYQRLADPHHRLRSHLLVVLSLRKKIAALLISGTIFGS